jgi:hypothetical protein
MGGVQPQRPATPNRTRDAWLSDSFNEDNHPSPSQNVPASSPRNSVAGNVPSLSSRNSSLSRSHSKASLRSLFSRGRSVSVASQRPDTSTTRGRPATRSGKHSRHSSATVVRAESPHLSQIGSRLDSYKPTQVTHATHIESARSKQQRARHRPSPSWDPPPLFQAYPQLLKHAVLDASCLPADVILRKSPYRNGRTPDDLATTDPTDIQGAGALLKKAKESKHARKLSASISSSGWTRHLFVLIESGYLLQYAGGGHHDRLPEKMMQLGKDTVAFASDAIPGRNWVLQVSQTAGNDAVVASDSSKGIFSRIGLQGLGSRRTTENFFMVFDNAEDLDCWLTTIRREVEALGGRRYGSETPTDMEARYLSSPRSVQRVSIQNDSYQFPGSQFAPHHHDLSLVQSEFLEQDGGRVDDQLHEFHFWEHETASQKISEDSSTITSTDLDRLRHSKDSGGSTNTGTSTSLHGPSPSTSPGCATFALRPFPSFESVDPSVVLRNRTGAPGMQELPLVEPHSPTFLCHALDASDIEEDTLRETSAAPSNRKRLSNIAPNFSVPISSTRFSFCGSSKALNAGSSRSTTATNSPIAENDPLDNDPTDDNSSRRPVSTIAPLPTPEALMNPAGTRTRNLRRPSTEKPLPSQPLPVHQQLTPSLSNHDYDSSSRHTATVMPRRYSSLEDAVPTLSAPLPPSKKELPALPRSRSSAGLSTSYNSGEASAPAALGAPPLRGRHQRRPLRLLGFPEPPSSAQPSVSSPMDEEVPDSSMYIKPLAPSSRTSLPTMTISKAPAEVNSRLSRINDSRGLLKLYIVPPSGPPPTCPLPDTPSPRKRHFRPLSKPNPSSHRNRYNALPSSRAVATL